MIDHDQLDNIIEELGPFIKKTNNVYAPIGDPVDYITITLNNKLRIFLIDDQDSNISSALMYVGIGSKDNPPNLEGLAHYLEHMLFMGSDLYPGGTFVQGEISKYGGYTNAFTANDSTQYFFSVGDNFLDLLKIFSRFFVKPLFDTKWVEKEVNAVNSEHNKNIGSDAWRLMNISRTFYDDGINNRFSTGSRDTLLGSILVNNDPEMLRDHLIKFYDDSYSSDNMVLFISHKIDDESINLISKMFEEVPLKCTTVKNETVHLTPHLTPTNNEIDIIRVKTVNKDHGLTIGWLLKGSSHYVDGVNIVSYDVLSNILNPGRDR